MTPDERDLFIGLAFSHKHLWIAFQELKHLKEFPSDDPNDVHERFCNEADEVYQPLEAALLAGQPLQEPLQTVLLMEKLAQAKRSHEN